MPESKDVMSKGVPTESEDEDGEEEQKARKETRQRREYEGGRVVEGWYGRR